MGKKSRHSKSERKQKAEAFQERLIEKTTKIDSGALIPATVAINPKIAEKLDEHFILAFDDYCDKQCELSNLKPAQARSLIRRFKEIVNNNPKTIANSGIIRDDVANSGKYKPLYLNISDDVQLKESEISNGGRIFFHLVNRYFCIVAIKTKHIDI